MMTSDRTRDGPVPGRVRRPRHRREALQGASHRGKPAKSPLRRIAAWGIDFTPRAISDQQRGRELCCSDFCRSVCSCRSLWLARYASGDQDLFHGPSRTIGALMPLNRRPAVKVVVLQWPRQRNVRCAGAEMPEDTSTPPIVEIICCGPRP